MTLKQADAGCKIQGVWLFWKMFWKQSRVSDEYLTEHIVFADSPEREPTGQAWRAWVWQILGGLQGTKTLWAGCAVTLGW